MMGNTYNPSTWESEAGESQVQDYLGYIERLCFKKAEKSKKAGDLPHW
jgi:hypothetical protein